MISLSEVFKVADWLNARQKQKIEVVDMLLNELIKAAEEVCNVFAEYREIQVQLKKGIDTEWGKLYFKNASKIEQPCFLIKRIYESLNNGLLIENSLIRENLILKLGEIHALPLLTELYISALDRDIMLEKNSHFKMLNDEITSRIGVDNRVRNNPEFVSELIRQLNKEVVNLKVIQIEFKINPKKHLKMPE